jgi:hypothetical protein
VQRAGYLEVFGEAEVLPWRGWATVYIVLTETLMVIYQDEDTNMVRGISVLCLAL